MSARPVQVDFSIAEARSVAAALDIAAHVMDCSDDRDGSELRGLMRRVRNGAVCAELEEQLGL